MRRQDGFTLVETLTAMVLLVTGALATFAVFDSARAATGSAERVQAATALLQREMESIRTLAWEDLGHALPVPTASGTQPLDPPAFLTSAGLRIERDYSRPGTATLASEPLVGGGTLAATTDVSGDIANATLHRFVSWRAEACAFQPPAGGPVQSACDPNDVHSKRITLAVSFGPVAGQGGRRNPVWLSSVVNEPDPAAGSLVVGAP